MTVTTTYNEAQLFHWGVIIFDSTLTRLLHLGKIFTIGMAEIMLLHSHAVELVTFQVVCHWPKNNSPVGKISTVCW